VTIREVDQRQNRVKIEMNGLSMWAEPSVLRLCDAKPSAPAVKGSVLTHMSDESTPFMRLDVRGRRADEALAEIERFLDRSLLSGVEGVDIVHGRGTGALRREIHKFLRSHPGVANFAVANEDCGGDGVTTVTFR
jgi:DNA mismatch repair protein MutS2